MKKTLLIMVIVALTGCTMVLPDPMQQCAVTYQIVDGKTTSHDLFRTFGTPTMVYPKTTAYQETRLYIMPTSEFSSLRIFLQLEDGIVKNHACSNWGRYEPGSRPW